MKENFSKNYVFSESDKELWQKSAVAVGKLAKLSAKQCTVLIDSFSFKEFPYHGLRHCVGVGWRARCGAVSSGFDEDSEEVRNITIAGLFHDAGYLGEKDDEQNIKFSQFLWNAASTHDEKHNNTINALIESTCFPHDDKIFEKFKYIENFKKLAQIIQDADVLETLVNPDMAERLTMETGMPADTNWAKNHVVTSWGRDVSSGKITTTSPPA